MLSLRISKGKQKDRIFSIEVDCAVLGRDSTCEVVIVDETASRRHARILRRDGLYLLQDLRSSNGTYVNGERIAEFALRPNDLIRVGNTTLAVSLESADRRVPAPGENQVHLRARDDREGESSTVLLAVVDVAQSTFRDLDVSHLDSTAVQQRLSTVYAVAELFGSGLPLPRLLAGVLDIVFEAVPADRGCILLQPEGAAALECVASKSRDPTKDATRISISQTILRHATAKGVAILSSDMASDSRFEGSKSAVLQGIRAAVCVPLMRGGRCLGVLHVDTNLEGKSLENEDLRLLTAIGNGAALAIDNTRLTEEKIRSERLKAVGQAMADFSHYVKNLVQGMLSHAPFMDQAIGAHDWEMLTRSWARLREYHGKIADLVQNTLLACGEHVPDVRPSSIEDIVGDCLDVFEQRAKAVNVEFKASFEPEVAEVEVDPEWIHRALLKIIENGIEAMEGTGGTLSVSTALDSKTGFLDIVVADSGPGIPEKEQPRVFEYFYSTKGIRGTGLGLAIAKKLIEGNGGFISLDSELGRGTTFHIQLPVAHRVRFRRPTDSAP